MKTILSILSVVVIIIICNAPVSAQGYAQSIRINKEQDPDSMYIMISETAPGKYRQGKFKSVNYEDWIGTLPGGSDNIFSEPIDDDRAVSCDDYDIRITWVDSFYLFGRNINLNAYDDVTIEANDDMEVQGYDIKSTAISSNRIDGGYVYITAQSGSTLSTIEGQNSIESNNGGNIALTTYGGGAVALSSSGNITMTAADGQCFMQGSTVVISQLSAVPSTASSTGVVGQIAFDENFIYRCVATDTWKRAAISTW